MATVPMLIVQTGCRLGSHEALPTGGLRTPEFLYSWPGGPVTISTWIPIMHQSPEQSPRSCAPTDSKLQFGTSPIVGQHLQCRSPAGESGAVDRPLGSPTGDQLPAQQPCQAHGVARSPAHGGPAAGCTCRGNGDLHGPLPSRVGRRRAMTSTFLHQSQRSVPRAYAAAFTIAPGAHPSARRSRWGTARRRCLRRTESSARSVTTLPPPHPLAGTVCA